MGDQLTVQPTMSSASMICIIDKRLNRVLYSDSPRVTLLACVQEDCLGVAADGWWAPSSAHENIRLTKRGEVRLVSRERSQVSEPPTEPSQGEAGPLALLPGPNTVTREARVF